jgi:hypothetical protein
MALTNNNTDLRPTATPNFPQVPLEYNQLFMDQFSRVVRQYLIQNDSVNQNLLTTNGLRFVSAPYGAFSSSVTQTTATNTATALTYNTTDFSSGVSVVSNTNITPTYSGIYNLQFSVQLQSLSNATEDVFIWLRQYTAKTATLADIAGSTGFVGMLPRKSAGNPSHDIKGWNYFVSMAAGDYIQIIWSTTNGTDVTIPYYAASGTPTKPSTQSVVATLTFVSRLIT